MFGKLFIDIKTLFFDCDNCEAYAHVYAFERCNRLTFARTVLFYILTDADSQRDHVLGFFSKVMCGQIGILSIPADLLPHIGKSVV